MTASIAVELICENVPEYQIQRSDFCLGLQLVKGQQNLLPGVQLPEESQDETVCKGQHPQLQHMPGAQGIESWE